CEIVSAHPAYQGISHDIELQRAIVYKGKRPIIQTHVPKLVVELINKCLNAEPDERPTSKEVYQTTNIWYNEILNNKQTTLVAQVKKVDEMIVNNLDSKLPRPEKFMSVNYSLI
ncbi:36107_t:CDS:1, partial [Gigaspora margarita]